METKQEQQSEVKRDTWLDHVLDALPFMFAAFVIVLVLLTMMAPDFEAVYSNTVNTM